MKINLFLLFFVILSGRAEGQTPIGNQLYFNLSEKPELSVSEQIVKWELSDYETLSQIIKMNVLIDSTASYQKTLEQFIEKEVLAFSKQEVLETEPGIWVKSDFPKYIQILKQEKYQQKVKDKTVQRVFNLVGFCALSKPCYSSEGNLAVIKLDYSNFHYNSNSCRLFYLFFELKNGKWTLTKSFGSSCMIE